jgi:hypothetical protein
MWLESASIRLIQELFLPGEINRMRSQPKGQDEGPFMAGDCLLAQSLGGPLTRKLPLDIKNSAAKDDPIPTHNTRIVTPFLKTEEMVIYSDNQLKTKR